MLERTFQDESIPDLRERLLTPSQFEQNRKKAVRKHSLGIMCIYLAARFQLLPSIIFLFFEN